MSTQWALGPNEQALILQASGAVWNIAQSVLPPVEGARLFDPSIVAPVDNQLPTDRGKFQNALYLARDHVARHFDVSHRYVAKKVALLLFPYTVVMHCCRSGDRADPNWSLDKEGERGSFEKSRPSCSSNERSLQTPDLYIPLISFITYIILFAWSRGTVDNFQPNILSERTTLGVMLLMAEALVLRLVEAWLSISGKFLDCVSACGYKYVHMSVMIGAGLLTRHQGTLYASIYTYLLVCGALSTLILSLDLNGDDRHEDHLTGARKRLPLSTIYLAVILAILQVYQYSVKIKSCGRCP